MQQLCAAKHFLRLAEHNVMQFSNVLSLVAAFLSKHRWGTRPVGYNIMSVCTMFRLTAPNHVWHIHACAGTPNKTFYITPDVTQLAGKQTYGCGTPAQSSLNKHALTPSRPRVSGALTLAFSVTLRRTVFCVVTGPMYSKLSSENTTQQRLAAGFSLLTLVCACAILR